MKADTVVPWGTGSYFPVLASKRAYIGGWAQLSVVQYFVAESAVIEAWRGPEPYDRRTGFISDLGAMHCGVYEDRNVCSPLHLLMNASFVVQGLGLVLGALLLNSALLCIAARSDLRLNAAGRNPAGLNAPGLNRLPRPRPGTAYRKSWLTAVLVRILTGAAGTGTVMVGLVPEDVGSPWHVAGAVTFFLCGGAALILLGVVWLRHTPMSWFILACGGVTIAALAAGAATAMVVPEPGTLERLMGYPVTIGFSAAGLVIAQRVRQERRRVRAALSRP